jgi:adenylate kinase family enzyme
MKKVAVFGNAGGGKSALAQRLAELTGLPLYVVDMMQFKPGGAKVPHDDFLQAHADIPSVTNGSSTVLAIWRLPGSGSPPPIR